MEKTPAQQKIALDLAAGLGIDQDDIYFLNPLKPEEVWLSPGALTAIARQSPELREVDEEFNDYVPGLRQIIYKGIVTDAQGRRFARTGVATIGEKPGMDEHKLAAGRALSSALRAAGFDPLKAGNVVAPNFQQERQVLSEGDQRRKDLGRIKIVARECGYITDSAFGEDFTHYRATLERLFGVRTAATLTSEECQSFIQYMLTNQPQLPDAPDEFHEMEVAA